MSKSGPNLKAIFSLEEELTNNKRDEHGRYAASFSKTKHFSSPVVSEHIVNSGVIDISYPNNHKFAVCISHDIDDLFIPKKISGKELIKNTLSLKINSASKNILTLLNKRKNPYFNLKDLIKIENDYNANATYFFLALKKHEKDFNYKLEEIKDVFKIIKKSGSEIALHGGHDAYKSSLKIIEEKKYLEKVSGQKIIGYRNHYLKFILPDTWAHLIAAGIKYDSTLGFHDKIGFRNGMCHPFSPYDLINNRHLDIVEIPLVVMDCSLDNYMGLDIENSWIEVKSLIDKVHSIGGVFSLLWHNSYFFGPQLELYKQILSYCNKKNGWLTSCENLYGWWKKEKHELEFYNYLDS